MNCTKVLDLVYEYSENKEGSKLPLFNQIKISLHTLFCQTCAKEIELLEKTRTIMNEDFFPVSPRFEDSIMAKINAIEESETEESYAIPGGISTRGWVIAGLVLLVSLVTAFFGLDFQNVADESGVSFMLPMGILIGIVLTTYGAFFVGSHLKELTERFGL